MLTLIFHREKLTQSSYAFRPESLNGCWTLFFVSINFLFDAFPESRLSAWKQSLFDRRYSIIRFLRHRQTERHELSFN